MDDDLSILSKVSRYAQVGGHTLSLLSRLWASQKTPYVLDDEAYAQHLKSILGDFKGPMMKVAQFLATVPGALPDVYAKAFLELQSYAPPMGPFFVKRRMQHELGNDWKSQFSSFDETPTFAASFGQVHKATSLTGEPLAVKLQYANMHAIVQADLNQLKVVEKTYRIFNKALDLEDVLKEVQEKLFEELDYEKEAEHLMHYGRFFENDPSVFCPNVIPHLSNKRILTMTWVEGNSILDCLFDLSQEQKNRLGVQLFKAWYRPFYLNGMIHGDPHPGNYKIDQNGRLFLLDFGCVRYFDNAFIEGVILLYHALKDNNQDLICQAYERWGFRHLSDEIIAILTKWARLLYDPLLDNQVRLIHKDLQGHVGFETALEVHRLLDEKGGIKIPREFVFMDRAAVGIGSVLMRLEAECNWHALFEEILQERSALNGSSSF